MRVKTSSISTALLLAFALLFAAVAPAGAEMAQIRVAQHYGISYLPLMIMEDQGLIEKHAKTLGVDVKVGWVKVAGGNALNEALLSGSLQFASGGVSQLITLWSRTRGTLDVKAVGAMNSIPLYLNARNPNVKTLKDFSEKDRIALPAVKVSTQAVTLQMAAEQVFGEGRQYKLDALTVSMADADAQAALLSGASEVSAHFSSPPFQYQQLGKPGVRNIVSSFDVLGGPATFNVIWTTAKFRNDNPKIYEAFVLALADATTSINRDKKATAETYVRLAKDKDSVDEVLKMLNDPNIVFTQTPQNTMKYADFMGRIGAIKVRPGTWKDLFFPNVHGLQGS